MAQELTGASHRQELVNVIREVRHRWRMKLLVRGAIIIVAGALLAIALASLGLQATKFSPTWVTGLRVATWAVLIGLLAFWLLRPLRKRVSDQQVALYIEEYEPSLQAAILSAIHVGALGTSSATEDVPQVIVDRMIEQAAEKARTIQGGKTVGRSHLKRYAIALGTVAGLAILLMTFGPEFLRQGASALLDVRRTAEAASPYAINVKPGDSTVPRGSDQMISAKLAGFRSNEVSLMVKPEGAPKFDRVPLVATADAMTFEGMLFDVSKPIEYYVEADGVRSLNYKMKIVELPAVAKLELEYIFPAYTGLPPQKVESGGDVAALRGTEVRVKVTPTMASPAGQLQLDPGTPSGLAAQQDGTLTGSFKMDKDGYYQIELDGPRGEKVTASPKYTVDVIEDQPPTVTFEKPKRDTSANPIEEVFVQARADDDFGVKQLDLIYSVNGGAEKTVSLYGKGAKPLPQVSAGHTVYLEELGVKPGDFVSYYAKAYDTDTVSGPKSTSSDIYFVKIMPFNQNFRQGPSQQGAGGGGGGGRQNQAGALSEQERQIISATFNVERDRPKTAADKFKENTVFISLSQSKLREQVSELVQQMQQRLGNDDNFRKIAEILPKAADEMKQAEDLLRGLKTKEALAPEQRALKQLQDAEQLYDMIVRQGGGGGGGGGGGQMASELADLFQLELDRQANQYEQAQRAQQQDANQQIDDLAERLRELARRQLAQAEQQRQRAQRGGNNASGGGSSQRQLADEVEQAARQLEQLRRQLEQQGQSRQDLADAARRLQDAANQMRQAAASNQNGGAQADQALQQLQEAQRLLQQSGTQRVGDAVKEAQRKAEDLARQQRDVAQQVAGLDAAGAQKDQKMSQLKQEKSDMKKGVSDLEQQLNQLGRQTLANNQRDAARKLQEAAGSIRDQMLKEKIEYSSEAMASGSEYSKPIENEIGSNLDSLKSKINDAASAVNKAEQGQGLSRAVDQAASLVRGTQSLNETLNQRLGQQGQQGDQQGQQGQQGQGQQGQQGQGQQGQGQQGRNGQQGQGQGQGQGQQGQGQQGQGQGQGQGGGQGRQGDRQGQPQNAQPGQPQGGVTRGNGGQPQGSFTGTPSSPGSTSSGDARPGLSSGDARDVRDNARQLANQAQDLRQMLQQSGATGKDLAAVDDIVKLLKQMDGNATSGDPRGLQQLAATALEKLTKFEWDLRKRVDTSNDALYLSGSEEMPANYKDLIEQYYRELNKKKKAGGGGK